MVNNRRWMGLASVGLVCLIGLSSCSPVLVSGGAKGKTSECEYMDDVCEEAEQFRAQYTSMPADEKKDMKEMLIGLESQCEEAIVRCKKSQKRKE